MTEKEKMLAGLLYDAADPELVEARARAHDLCHELALVRPSDTRAIERIVRSLLPHVGENLSITPPFFCDYGWNITLGRDFYCNTGCVILDVAPVSIGDGVLFGPGVQIYTATHPLDPALRAQGLELAAPIRIGHQVWLGGQTILCPGVSIGDKTVIGAGSVVTRDIPAGVLAAGNPCRIIKSLQE
jgi:maltose O-acetyltransferase